MPRCGEVVLDRGCREQRGRAQHVVAAAVPVAAGHDLLRLGDAGDLGEAGQRVVLAEDGDHRPALARLAHDRGRDAGEVLGDAEALLLQHGAVLGHGAVFGVADLRHLPDAVGERLVGILAGVDELPDLLRVLHDRNPPVAPSRLGQPPAGGRRTCCGSSSHAVASTGTTADGVCYGGDQSPLR